MREPRGDGERLVERVVSRLAAGITPPSADELRRRARMAASPREPQARDVLGRASRRPARLRWMLAAASLILLATGLGFGFGAWLTPAGSAQGEPIGLGFLPAKGWTVVQSGTTGATASARAVAANVPLDAADPAEGTPWNTLRVLQRDGVVIVATLTTRGDVVIDRRFPVRELPLRFVDADVASTLSEPVASERRLTTYRLRAGVGGYDVDARIYFGSRPPSVSALKAAEQQLERLVVAPAQLTIAVRPSIAGAFGPVTVYGSVASGKAGQKVTVQFKECGLYPVQFRDVAELTTSEGGGFSAEVGAGANGAFRAVAGDAVSNQAPVQSRADVRLSPRPPGRYQAYVVDKLSYWRKRVVIQRFDRRLGRWAKVKTLRLEHQFAAPGSAFVWSETDKFAVKLPKGTTIRAVLPLDQAKPCHIGGYSSLLRT